MSGVDLGFKRLEVKVTGLESWRAKRRNHAFQSDSPGAAIVQCQQG